MYNIINNRINKIQDKITSSDEMTPNIVIIEKNTSDDSYKWEVMETYYKNNKTKIKRFKTNLYNDKAFNDTALIIDDI